ncbi:MAG TPA: ZIP family metal transporter [Rhodocyclaceae bacterium]|nr:ZIP family metal transporter [Rhodocyclaceae bacterium]
MNLPIRAMAAPMGVRPGTILRCAVGIAITVTGLVFLMDRLGEAVVQSRAALEAGLLAALATALGALPALFMKGTISHRSRNAMLGFSAGVMLAASAFSLLLPAINFGAGLFGDRLAATFLAALALAAGVAGMLYIERHVPHSHEVEDADGTERRGVWLLVLAIAIHNFPEGLAIGAAVSGGGTDSSGQSVTYAIALQDMPEGLVVAVSLAAVGLSRWLAFAIGAASGLAEPLAAALSAQVIGTAPVLYPIGLAVAAGAMLFVVSHEIIPGTHRRGGESIATLGLTLGFAAMLVIDGSFG